MASESLRAALAGIGERPVLQLALEASFGRSAPPSLRAAIAGMTDPGVAQWTKVGKALWSENTDLSEEAQGATTDGNRWYVCSNNTKAVVAFDNTSKRVGTYKPTSGIIEQMWKDAGSPALPSGLLGAGTTLEATFFSALPPGTRVQS